MIKVVEQRRVLPGGITQIYVLQNRLEIMLSFIEVGTMLQAHQHEQPQFGYCLRNSLDFAIHGVSSRLEANDGYVLRAHTPHAATNAGDKTCIALDVKYHDIERAHVSEDEVLRQRNRYEDSALCLIADSAEAEPIVVRRQGVIVVLDDSPGVAVTGADEMVLEPFNLYLIDHCQLRTIHGGHGSKYVYLYAK